MTFPFFPNPISAKLFHLLLVSATTHPQYIAPALGLQDRLSEVSENSYLGAIIFAGNSHGGGGAILGVIAAVITAIGGIIVAIISRRK